MNIKRVILASVVGAIVAFIWTLASWMALSWHDIDFRSFADDKPVAQTIMSQTTDSGIYMLPNADPDAHNDPEKHAQWISDAAKGPFALIVLKREGTEIVMGMQMLKMIMIQFAAALLFTLLLAQTRIQALAARAVFVMVAAVAGGAIVHLSNWAWWGFPVVTTLVGIADMAITWLLAGFAIGKIYKANTS